MKSLRNSDMRKVRTGLLAANLISRGKGGSSKDKNALPDKENNSARRRPRFPQTPSHADRWWQELRLFQPRGRDSGGWAGRYLAPSLLDEGAARESGPAREWPHRHSR